MKVSWDNRRRRDGEVDRARGIDDQRDGMREI